jgi:hypothetical protein
MRRLTSRIGADFPTIISSTDCAIEPLPTQKNQFLCSGVKILINHNDNPKDLSKF